MSIASKGELEFLDKYGFRKLSNSETPFSNIRITDHKEYSFRFIPDLVLYDAVENKIVIVEYKDSLPLLSTGKAGGKTAVDSFRERYKANAIKRNKAGYGNLKNAQRYYKTLGWNHSVFRMVAIKKCLRDLILGGVEVWIVDPASEKHVLMKQKPERNQKTVRSQTNKHGVRLMNTGEFEKRYNAGEFTQILNLPLKDNLKISWELG